MVLPSVKTFARMKFITNAKREQKATEKYINELKIKTPGMNQLVKFLSGGNQQKVVLGKWLMTHPNILIFDEPTRGIDIGAKTEIYKIINDLAEQGNAIIFISSEMQEILGMCDRIIVFHEGLVSGELSKEEATQEKLLKLATGTN
jgi:ABC-type sugar transport system ATPase subunit